ncbi:MAG: flavodoxin family protein [Candidatus Cloacimonetes bacterium HGW-Cloacimonetes-1]|jgi:multimeric flavodoxin WrbA|nr:MAG: flavodoxin family protein [Candidatus Cloacimonetes bacterium HGW-Cloacimonetes-1]
MKILAINGSPHHQGNTRALIDMVCSILNSDGISTEVFQLGGKLVHGCTACGKCFENKDGKCIIQNDCMNELMALAFAADGLLIGSPTYFCNVSTELKAFIDRAGMVSLANSSLLQRKLGAAVVAVRRAGSIPTFNAINHFFLINQMIIPGSCYWNMGIGLAPKDVLNDEEGVNIMKTLGKNMAWLMQKLH